MKTDSPDTNKILRLQAEVKYAEELSSLQKWDTYPRPTGWMLSPVAVVEYLIGGKVIEGMEIEPKYYGSRRLMEIAVATLATDRALLLIGVPGTAKSWVSEHIAAAISGDSRLLVQGTAGLGEEAIRYGWNYAKLIAEGPGEEALVPGPVMRAMQTGKIARLEELTRMPSEVQDALITVLSEKVLPVPELNREVQARKGFNIIATANDRDKGVNELSAALKRRFNTIVLPLPATLEDEVKIVKARVGQQMEMLELPVKHPPEDEVKRLVTIFRELRTGKTLDGKTRIKSPQSTLSTAEAISVINNGQALAAHFGEGELKAADLAAGLVGAIVKDQSKDQLPWQEYLETIIKKRNGWSDLYRACKSIEG